MLQVARHLFTNLGELVGKYQDESDFPCMKSRNCVVSMFGDSLLNSLVCPEWGSRKAMGECGKSCVSSSVNYYTGNGSDGITCHSLNSPHATDYISIDDTDMDEVSRQQNTKTETGLCISEMKMNKKACCGKGSLVSSANKCEKRMPSKPVEGQHTCSFSSHAAESSETCDGVNLKNGNFTEDFKKEEISRMKDNDSVANIEAGVERSKGMEYNDQGQSTVMGSESQLSFVTALGDSHVEQAIKHLDDFVDGLADADSKCINSERHLDLEEIFFDSEETCEDTSAKHGEFGDNDWMKYHPDILGCVLSNEEKGERHSGDSFLNLYESATQGDSRSDLNNAFVCDKDIEVASEDLETTVNAEVMQEVLAGKSDDKAVKSPSKLSPCEEPVEAVNDVEGVDILIVTDPIDLSGMQAPGSAAGSVSLGRCSV